METQFKTMQDIITEVEILNKAHAKRLKFSAAGVKIDGNYYIEAKRINTPHKLLAWVFHLKGKSWMDINFLGYFTEQVAEWQHINIHIDT